MLYLTKIKYRFISLVLNHTKDVVSMQKTYLIKLIRAGVLKGVI